MKDGESMYDIFYRSRMFISISFSQRDKEQNDQNKKGERQPGRIEVWWPTEEITNNL